MTKWIPTEAILEKIADLAEQRLNEVDIAKAVGLASTTWWQKKKEYPEIQKTLDDARLSTIQFVRSKLMAAIEDPNNRNHFQATTFYLKHYDPEIVRNNKPEVVQPQLPTGFTWRIVTQEDVDAAKGEQP